MSFQKENSKDQDSISKEIFDIFGEPFYFNFGGATKIKKTSQIGIYIFQNYYLLKKDYFIFIINNNHHHHRHVSIDNRDISLISLFYIFILLIF